MALVMRPGYCSRRPRCFNTIGGISTIFADNVFSGAANDIAGNVVAGVVISHSNDNFVEGNSIGLFAQAQTSGVGIRDGSVGNVIGGTIAGELNRISGNRIGVGITGQGTDDNKVEGNLIGLFNENSDKTSGGLLVGNSTGVLVSGGASHNTIGGANSHARNIIGGNSDSGGGVFLGLGSVRTLVEENYIGVGAAGNTPLGNDSGVSIIGSNSNTITSNTISDNSFAGIDFQAFSGHSPEFNSITGNFIGTNTTGTSSTSSSGGSLGNVGDGILIEGGQHNTIGGSSIGSGNVISGTQVLLGVPGSGIQLEGFVGGSSITPAQFNLIEGNFIGTDITGKIALPNAGDGITLSPGTNNTIIGGTSTPRDRRRGAGVDACAG